MIVSFKDNTTADLYHGRQTKRVHRLSPDVKRIALRKLDILNAADNLEDLREPPGNRLKALKGDLSGYHSLTFTRDNLRVSRKCQIGKGDKSRREIGLRKALTTAKS